MQGGRALSRRTVLIGAGGMLLVTGCGGGEDGGASRAATASASPTPTGPRINGKDAGNTVTTEDVSALMDAANRAFAKGDLEALRRVIRYDDFQADLWQRRLRAGRTVPLQDVRFYLEQSSERVNNSSGGAVEFRANLVLSHRIAESDPFPVSQLFGAELVKPSTDAPLEFVRTSSSSFQGVSPLPWELAEVASVSGEHAVLLTRASDLDDVRRYLAAADAGVRRAQEVVGAPDGAPKVAMTLAWDEESGEKIYGGSARTRDRDGIATYVGFVDPQQLADGTAPKEGLLAEGDGVPLAGRVLLRRSARDRDAQGFEDLACHEAVHALAAQWGLSVGISWVAEGLATWVEEGFVQGVLASEGAEARAGFAGFRRDLSEGLDFQDPATSSRNYACSAAVFACVEDTRDRRTAVALARNIYRSTTVEGIEETVGLSPADLFSEVQTWLARS